MSIVTVTMNPALDQTISVDDFHLGTVNRGQAMQVDPGGKGVNVASFLADAGYGVTVTGFLGEDNPELFERLCDQKGMADAFVRIPGRTRTGIKIVDQAQRQTTDINMPGTTPPHNAVITLRATLDALASRCDWFILSGSLPPGLPPDIYATLITRLNALGKHAVLDTSGRALCEGISAGPTIVKPNVDELQQLVKRSLETPSEIERAGRQLLDHGISLVVVSMGARGAIFINAHASLLATPPRVSDVSSVGAGDAMVAGLVVGQIRGLDMAGCARLATAFSVGAVTRIGAHLPPPEQVEAYRSSVTILPLLDVAPGSTGDY